MTTTPLPHPNDITQRIADHLGIRLNQTTQLSIDLRDTHVVVTWEGYARVPVDVFTRIVQGDKP